MKRAIPFGLMALLCLGLLAGCWTQEGLSSTDSNSSEISTASSQLAVYEALDASPTGNIAVKLSTGEPGSNYLRPELIGDLVRFFENPTTVECNTAYGGQRVNTSMHYQVAEDHG